MDGATRRVSEELAHQAHLPFVLWKQALEYRLPYPGLQTSPLMRDFCLLQPRLLGRWAAHLLQVDFLCTEVRGWRAGLAQMSTVTMGT